MKKRFSKVLAGIMAFMMLFASVAFAEEKVKQLDLVDKSNNETKNFSITREDCQGPIEGYDKDGKKITYYKFTFKPYNDEFYDLATVSGKAYNANNKTPVYNEDGTVRYYTGALNVYLQNGSETLPGSVEKYNPDVSDEPLGTFDLNSEQVYCSYFTEEQFGSDGTIEYEYMIDTSIVRDTETGGYKASIEEYDKNTKNNEKTTFGAIEEALAMFCVLVGKTANWMLGVALNKTLTIDDIVFNTYDEIRLDYFNFGLKGNTVTSNSRLINALKTPINKCYNVFTQIAIIGYMIVLVYIGIQLLLNSTSADKKASAKNALVYWVTGIVILFFYPYAMKYIILAEDAFVRDIGRESQSPASKQLFQDGANYEMIADMDTAITYDASDKDYMSRIGYEAQQTQSLTLSLAYLILTWQLIMLVVYYYKRAFTVAFLIMVFPLVALTYIFDKLNDGKSQALSAWTREFVIDVVIQIFHAVVYVFVANTIYATIDSGHMDTILIMIAVTFMFEGENIMKQIFGGGKTVSTGSAAKSGAKIAALAGLGVRTAVQTAKVGFKGLNGIRNAAMVPFDMFRPDKDKRLSLNDSLMRRSAGYRNLRNNWDLMDGGFWRLAENGARNRRIAQILTANGNITKNINDTAEAIEEFNNGPTRRDTADGLYKLLELMKKRNSPNGMTDQEKRQFDAMLQASNISPDQLENIQKGMIAASVAAGSSSKPDYKRISRNLRLNVEYSFSNLSGSERTRMTNRVHAALMYNLKNGYVDHDAIEDSIKDNWEQKRENTYRFAKNIKFRPMKRSQHDNLETVKKMQKTSQKYQRQLASKIVGYNNLSYSEKKKIMEVGNALSYIKLTEAEQLDKLRDRFDSLNQDFGVNQQIVEEFIRSHVNLNDVQDTINNGGSSVRGAKLVQTRKEGLKKQFMTKYKNKLPADFDDKQLDQMAEDYAKLELLNSGEISAVEAAESAQRINLNDENYKRLLKIANLDSEIDSLKYLISKALLESNQPDTSKLTKAEKVRYDKSVSWARDTVDTMENTSVNPAEKDPVTSIYDIIDAAKKRNGGVVGSIDDLYNNSGSDGMLDSKVDANVEAGKALGKKILGGDAAELWDEASFLANGDVEDQDTVLGYTAAELMRMQNIDAAHNAKETMGLVGDITVKPFTTFLGGVIGVALTDDGMPLGEGVTGMIAGATAGDKINETVSNLVTRDAKLQAEKKEIMSQVDKRLKKEEKDRLKARQAFADAAASASASDNLIKINYVSANYYENASGDPHVTLKVIADNATWMCVGEPRNLSSWFTYVEDYDYALVNPKAMYLYIRLKDNSGNIVDYTAKLNNPNA